MAKDIQQLERVQRRAACFVKKDDLHTTSVTGLLDELGLLPLFECRKHSRLTVFYKALNNLSAISLDHLSVSSRHTRASDEKKFMSLPVRTDVFKYSLFFGPLLIGIPFWLFVSRSQLSSSTGLCWTRHPPTVADHHDTPAVMGVLHPLLDISPKNRRMVHGHVVALATLDCYWMTRLLMLICIIWVWSSQECVNVARALIMSIIKPLQLNCQLNVYLPVRESISTTVQHQMVGCQRGLSYLSWPPMVITIQYYYNSYKHITKKK